MSFRSLLTIKKNFIKVRVPLTISLCLTLPKLSHCKARWYLFPNISLITYDAFAQIGVSGLLDDSTNIAFSELEKRL